MMKLMKYMTKKLLAILVSKKTKILILLRNASKLESNNFVFKFYRFTQLGYHNFFYLNQLTKLIFKAKLPNI